MSLVYYDFLRCVFFCRAVASAGTVRTIWNADRNITTVLKYRMELRPLMEGFCRETKDFYYYSAAEVLGWPNERCVRMAIRCVSVKRVMFIYFLVAVPFYAVFWVDLWPPPVVDVFGWYSFVFNSVLGTDDLFPLVGFTSGVVNAVFSSVLFHSLLTAHYYRLLCWFFLVVVPLAFGSFVFLLIKAENVNVFCVLRLYVKRALMLMMLILPLMECCALFCTSSFVIAAVRRFSSLRLRTAARTAWYTLCVCARLSVDLTSYFVSPSPRTCSVDLDKYRRSRASMEKDVDALQKKKQTEVHSISQMC